MKITKDKIRLRKASYNVDGKYWYHPEILSEGTWFSGSKWYEPYAVNYKTLETNYWLNSISPSNDYILKKFLEDCLLDINKYTNTEDWHIVDRNEYYRIRKQYEEQERNKNKYVYINE